MAFSNAFTSKNFRGTTFYAGRNLPKVPRPQRFDVWFQPSVDGYNVDTFVYDKENTTWQRGVKIIPTATNTDPTGLVNGVSSVQTVTLTNSPTGGTFTLSFGGQTTAGIAYNASASTVQTALQGLSSVGAGNMTVSGSGPYVVTAAGTLANKAIGPITGNGASLTGAGAQPAVTVAQTTPGVSPVAINSATDDIRVGDIWVNYSTGSSVFKMWNGTAWI